jgi:hypothetical protein
MGDSARKRKRGRFPASFMGYLHRVNDSIQIIVRDFQFRRAPTLLTNRRTTVWIPENLLARFDLEAARAFSCVSCG